MPQLPNYSMTAFHYSLFLLFATSHELRRFQSFSLCALRLKSTLSTTSPKFVYWGTHLNPEAVFFYLKERPADVILFKGEGKVWIGKNALLLIQKF